METSDGNAADAAAWALAYQPFEIAAAAIVLVLLTLLIVAIELPSHAKTSRSACLNTGGFLYFCISLFGFVATTLLAANVVGNRLPGWPPFWHIFFGVFGFQILLKQTNITLFDKGVLTIQDWIQKRSTTQLSSRSRRNSRNPTIPRSH